MKTYQFKLESCAPYTSSKMHGAEKIDKNESPAAYDQRTWREKAHWGQDGIAFIPPMAFKFAISSAARKRGEKIPGKGQKTWAKIFDSGIMVLDPIPLGVTKEKIQSITVNCNADGVRGSGKRVPRIFPIVQSWSGTLTVHVLDTMIDAETLVRYVDEAGKFIGVGQYRPENLGINGRWAVKSWKEVSV
jgi:hypothetical protein